MSERVRVREISDEEGNRLLRLLRRSGGSVVTWRRAQMVLLSAQGMEAVKIAEVAFTSPDRVREVIHNFNTDGFDALYPKYAGGRPPKFTAADRAQIRQIALPCPADHGLPFSTWSLSKLAEFLVAEGVVGDISHEGLRTLLHQAGVSFQAVKTFKTSTDPDYEAKKHRVLHLYDLADGRGAAGEHSGDGLVDPEAVICLDEFGPFEPPTPPGQAVGPAGCGARRPERPAPASAPGDVHPPAWGASPAGGVRPVEEQGLRPREGAQDAHSVSGVLPLPAVVVPDAAADRDRVRQLLTAPVHEDRSAGR